MWRTQLLTVWPRCPKRLFDGGDSSLHDLNLIILQTDQNRKEYQGIGAISDFGVSRAI